MRILLLAATALFVLLATAACGSSAPDRPTPSPSDVTPELASVSPTETPSAEQQVRHCVEKLAVRETGVAGTLSRCIAASGYPDTRVRAVEGPSPIYLVEVKTQEQCGEHEHFIVWPKNDTFDIQNLTSELVPGAGYDLLGKFSHYDGTGATTPTEARESENGAMIGLTTVNYYCTSDPRADILLLVRDGDSWRIARNVGTNPDLSELAHGTAEFIGEGIDDVSVAGSSWRRTDDPKSQVFFESNAGPHRWYEQKWRREGTQYVLKSERVLPSAYATLVDFVYALSNGDDSAAASLTTDSSLVATAKQVGLVRRVGERPWFGHCRGEFVYDLEKEPPCTVTLPNDTHVVVSMVRDGENWLVSGIELQPAS